MTVATPSPEVLMMRENWTLIDALMGGTRAMRGASKRYLPKWPAEDEASYQSRLQTATLFPAYSRTVSVLTGKPFSKQLTIGEDVPPRIVEWLDNVDLQNRSLHVFASEICAETLAYGLSGILVDCPPSNGARTVADERLAAIRPYLIHIHPQNILGWKSEQINGNHVLTQLRLMETVEVDAGDFATRMIDQVRVLVRGGWMLFRKTENLTSSEDEWVLYDQGLTTLTDIPFVPVYGLRQNFMVGIPPMLELGYANVEHWQSKSDQQTILHIARVPVMFAKMLNEEPFTVGAGTLVKSNQEGADMKYVEHSGAAIESGRMSILDLEDRMRQIGAELLVIKPGNITVAQTLADNEPGMCDLQRIMQSVENSLDQSLDFMADWVGEKTGGHVSIYRDFGAATLAEASASLLFEMRSVGALSFETLLNELKRRGILGPDLDVEDEMIQAKADAPPVTVTENVRA